MTGTGVQDSPGNSPVALEADPPALHQAVAHPDTEVLTFTAAFARGGFPLLCTFALLFGFRISTWGLLSAARFPRPCRSQLL